MSLFWSMVFKTRIWHSYFTTLFWSVNEPINITYPKHPKTTHESPLNPTNKHQQNHPFFFLHQSLLKTRNTISISQKKKNVKHLLRNPPKKTSKHIYPIKTSKQKNTNFPKISNFKKKKIQDSRKKHTYRLELNRNENLKSTM